MPLRRASRISQRLLRWYDRERRDLPWRRTSDPYAIWLAEVMLQQTQVATALPFYRRFLKTFPNVAALDRATMDEVLSLWSGLGYYRRARNLKRAARQLMEEYGGKIPCDFDALRRLPGVGRYTAGAVMSIAFGRHYAALDGNALRVLARVFMLHWDAAIEKKARELLPRRRPGDFNQALMELGSTVCRARQPLCPVCPLAACCAARESGSVRLAAASVRRRKQEARDWPLALVRSNGKILLRRRPAGSALLEGLWEVPGDLQKKREGRLAVLRRVLAGLPAKIELKGVVGEFRHHITYRRLRVLLFDCGVEVKRGALSPEWRWVPLHSARELPLSALSSKAIALLGRCR